MRFTNRATPTSQQPTTSMMPFTAGAFNGMQPFGMPPSVMQAPMPLPMGAQAQTPALPTGYPTGGSVTPLLPTQGGAMTLPTGEQIPTTLQSTLFTPGFLKTQIGKKMRVEFLVGTGTLIDRSGTLIGVGASYILLRLIESDDIMMCDIYSIKFVTILL